MHFANPSVLWALFLLIIPIIIHLFKFRRYKQVQFPNIRFLQKIDQDQKAKRRLKDILILISRLLTLTALVFAFAMPFLGKNIISSKGNLISIYVDNSFSMENESDQGKLLDIAKKKAEELAMTFQASDQFQLLTNDLETRHQRIVNRQAFLQFLYEIDLSASTVDMSNIYQRQVSILEEEQEYDKWISIISDMQSSTSDLENIITDSDINLLFIPISPDNYNNVYIDSLWFEDPARQLGKSEVLHFVITNESDENLDEVAVRLEIDGQMKSMANLAIDARSKKDTFLHFTNEDIPGIQNAILKVDDKPIEFDNDYFFTYRLKEKIKVSEIHGKNADDYYKLVYSDTLYTYTSFSVDQIDFQSLGEADLIVFNDLEKIPSGLSSFIIKWLGDGGHLFVSPGEEISTDDYTKFLANVGATISTVVDTIDRRVSYIELDDEIFKGVLKEKPKGRALPNTYSHFTYGFSDFDWVSIFRLQGNDSFLASRKVNRGRIYLLAVPNVESWSNWPRHALFITTMLRISEESQRSEQLEYRIGDWSTIEIQSAMNTDDRPIELKAKDGSIAFIPTQQWINGKLSIAIKDEVKKAGFYDLMNKDEVLYTLAFNYSRKESDLRFLSMEDIDKWMEGKEGVRVIEAMNKKIKKSTIREERPLWKYFIIAALLFILLEISLIKLIKE